MNKAAESATIENDPAKLVEYEDLIKSGMLESEARATVWPEQLIEGAEIVQFPGNPPENPNSSVD